MNWTSGAQKLLFIVAAFILIIPSSAYAQHLLNKTISITERGQPLATVLSAIGKQGDFYFSYNSNILPGDSAVSLSVRQKPVYEILDMLLGENYAYKESGNYIILRQRVNNGDPYIISGYVINKATGDRIAKASVYENRQLISTLTDERGFFSLRLKTHTPKTFISISKTEYNDTLLVLNSGYNQELTVPVTPMRSIMLKPVTITPYSRMEGKWFGKFFISSKQKIQDINLSRFFVRQPFQYSVVPGMGTHGKLSAQIINKFSFNVFGGYTAGVNGFELGGLFNIDKRDVQYVQIAGLFNTVGGSVKGFQAAGLHNGVLDSVNGFQLAGLNNNVSGSLNGFQAAGLFNHVAGEVSGMMLAGISNTTAQKAQGVQIGGIFNKATSITGLQLAGIGNISKATTNGAQISGVFNYTPNLEGLQIGLVNIADTSSGYSIGIINIIRNGYHGLSVSYNEALDINIAYKAGNKKLYNILLLSANTGKNKKAYSIGYGIGREFIFTSVLSFTAELTEQGVYTGHWRDMPYLTRLQPALQVKIKKNLSLFAGPSLSVCFPDASAPAKGYGTIVPAHHFSLWNHARGWLGGQAGISLHW